MGRQGGSHTWQENRSAEERRPGRLWREGQIEQDRHEHAIKQPITLNTNINN